MLTLSNVCRRTLVASRPQGKAFISPSVLPVRGIEEFIDRTTFEGKPLESAGKTWHAQELRLKGFADLHRLWIVLMKERNMLLSQRKLAKLMGGKIRHPERMTKVRKSMARIKTIIFERHRQASTLAKQEFEARKAKGYYKWPPQLSPEASSIMSQWHSQEGNKI